MQMKISEIKINPGRRDTQQRNVEELARSIAAVGLMNPITVTQHNTLIAGLLDMALHSEAAQTDQQGRRYLEFFNKTVAPHLTEGTLPRI